MINFTCNICAVSNTLKEVPWETPTCSNCKSNVRMRALIYMLSRELFGTPRPLPEFPHDKTIKGFGLTDESLYAQSLSEKFEYTNTFYHAHPHLDITEPHPDRFGTYDFILSGDVFEHVAPPVERAFEEAFRLLKPNGALCITVPSSPTADQTVEFYPELYEYKIVELGSNRILINQKRDHAIEIHQNLEFHEGIGATLAMRLFSQRDLALKLRAAGFSEVIYQTESVETCGIILDGDWSLPLVARKRCSMEIPALAAGYKGDPNVEAQFAYLYQEIATLKRQLPILENKLRLAADSRWLSLGRLFGVGPKLRR